MKYISKGREPASKTISQARRCHSKSPRHQQQTELVIVMSSDTSNRNLSNKGIPDNSTGPYLLTGDGTVEISDVFDLLKDTYDRVQCLQRAIAAICASHHDFKAEYSEDMAEVKRALQELRRNKIWIPRERL